ncbi:TlpA disulfide reductase family protein [Hymenobacter sp. BT559]|uniref:TlpA family protein disulfide reductase n=1 Tax=Hymenobacter sp. BT559 TaxID=2795729 RepID=UPI0018ED5D93|nr:TlpA disulfide reductase family protein [Hymenobacter sp. BT559]MBJ6142326.1 TlpA family protein disulfide reductase [Hymenobacter sp. BT559]
MIRFFTFVSLLAVSLPAVAQHVTKATVFTDVDGSVLSRKAYMSKLQTNQFVVADAQISNSIITAISLRPAPAPDSVRTQAISPVRTYSTPAPTFALTDIKGQAYDLAALRGKVVVVNFWFIKCAPCQQEMPALKQLTIDYRSNPRVVFLSLAREDAARLQHYVASKGDFGFAVIPLPQTLAEKFGITGYPTTTVIDRNGRFVYDNEGYAGNLTRLRKAIEQALVE